MGERCVWWCGFREECLDWRGVSSWADGWLRGERVGWLGSGGSDRSLNDLHPPPMRAPRELEHQAAAVARRPKVDGQQLL